MSLKVGIVGLGIMGGSFAKNLRDANFEVCGFDILDDNIQNLVSLGGNAGSSPRDVATQSDVVITSLPSIAAFHEVMSGKDGLKDAKKDGLIIIECSTLPIDEKQAAHDTLAEIGSILMDCPISGTGAQAINKDLSVYVSGEEAILEKCQNVLNGFANFTFYVGEFGNGSKMKFVANHLVHIHNVASAEAMVLGMKAGLEPETIFNVIKAGAGNSRIFELRGPMMVENNYDDATMKMDIWQKDMKTIGEFAAQLQCPTPLFTAGTDIYRSGLAKGMDKLDTASVCRVLEQMAGLERS
jgi:3-hydroxyisobutyrate dehydrogenase-like beta-hydroxyacid dehydrogenase